MNGNYIAKINYKCNSNCCFCADSKNIRETEDIDYNKLIYELEQNRKKFDSLIITGGEPTIYNKLPDYVSYAKKIGYKHISLTTNGLMLGYPNYADILINSGVDTFIISFATTDELIYDNITKVKGSFKQLNNALNYLNEKKVSVRINTVIHKFNYKNLKNIVKYLVLKNVKSIQLSFMNPIDESAKTYGISKLVIKINDLKPYISDAIKEAQNLNFNDLYIENFPICTMEEYKDKISDLKKPENNKDYYNSLKFKPENCRFCVYYNICDGTWKEYLKQFGDEEFKPIISDSIDDFEKLSEKYKNYNYRSSFKDINNLSNSLYFEKLGILNGFKKAAIFYHKKEDIPKLLLWVNSHNLFFEISDFVYNHKSTFVEKTLDNITPNSLYSIYVSKDQKICTELKYLDKYHQFDIIEPTGIKRETIFFRIGELLGYPKCCSEFIKNLHKHNSVYTNEFKNDNLYDAETVYPLVTYNQSKILNPLLNNFSLSIKLINIYLCNYNCKNSGAIAEKLFNTFDSDSKQIILDHLKTPFIFFSPNMLIYFKDISIINEKIHYSKCYYSLSNIIPIKDKILFLNRFSIFLEGDSFNYNNKNINIYNKNKLIFKISKNHKFDGVFINFDNPK